MRDTGVTEGGALFFFFTPFLSGDLASQVNGPSRPSSPPSSSLHTAAPPSLFLSRRSVGTADSQISYGPTNPNRRPFHWPGRTHTHTHTQGPELCFLPRSLQHWLKYCSRVSALLRATTAVRGGKLKTVSNFQQIYSK